MYDLVGLGMRGEVIHSGYIMPTGSDLSVRPTDSGSSVRWLVGLSNPVQSNDYPIQSNPRFISPLPSSAHVGINSHGSRYNNQDVAKTSCAEPCFKGKVRGHPFIMLAKFLGF